MSGDEEGLPKQHKGKREKQHKENRSGKYLRRIQACVEIARRGERLKSGGNPAVGYAEDITRISDDTEQ